MCHCKNLQLWSTRILIDFHSYIGLYALQLAFMLAVLVLASTAFVYGSLCASRIIHEELIDSVLGTTLRCV